MAHNKSMKYVYEQEESMELMDTEPKDSLNIHPLVIPTVVDNIISRLSSLQDLKSCRLVSKQWCEEACKFLHENIKVVLNSEERVLRFTSEFGTDQLLVESIEIGGYIPLGSTYLRKFFEMYGIHIKTLMLHKTVCTIPALQEILFRLAPNVKELAVHGRIHGTTSKTSFLDDRHEYGCPTLPNLEILNLNLTHNQGQHVLPVFLTSMFELAPNLKKICVPKNEHRGFLPALIDVILTTTEYLPLKNLACVDALFSFDDLQIRQLESKGLPLKYLNMQLMPNVTQEDLLPLLSSLGSTLSSLRLHFYLAQFKELPTLVPLLRLQQLSLHEYQGSLQFTSDLPELTELTVSMKSMEELHELFPNEENSYECWVSKSLRSFKSTVLIPGACTSSCVLKIAKSFPNLTCLSIQGLTDQSLRLIFNCYPDMTDLTLANGLFTDEGLTGISTSTIRIITSENPIIQAAYPSDRPHSNILNLRKLRKLALQSFRITDASIFLGVIMCKELRSLTLDRCDVTDKSISSIMDYMDLHHLTIARCTRVSGPQLEIVEQRMTNRDLIIDYNEKRYGVTYY